jgi:hypothetical protein
MYWLNAQVLVAERRCKEIADMSLASMDADQTWASLQSDVEASNPTAFGRRASEMMERLLQGEFAGQVMSVRFIMLVDHELTPVRSATHQVHVSDM